MKSQHRHELETNALAKRLADVIEQLQPYTSTVIGILIALVAVVLGISYMSGASAARQGEAWNSYNQAVEGLIPNLEMLRRSAEENASTPMEQWANITWADGQVWMAARAYVQNRAAAMEALKRATGAYQSLLQETEDERITSRAHFGLGRVYELQNQLDKARDEYLAVQGGFALLAKQRAEDLAKKDTKETYDWLATAEAPRRAPPSGPGTPGKRPEFSAGDIEMPGEEKEAAPGTTSPVDDLFKDFGPPAETADRYNESGQDAAAAPGNTATDDASQGKPADAAPTNKSP